MGQSLSRSKKAGLLLRRVECKATGESFTVRPSFVLPYLAGYTDEVEKSLFLRPLFLRCLGVPFWALARVFGKGPMYWQLLEVSLGRNSVTGTTWLRPSPAWQGSVDYTPVGRT